MHFAVALRMYRDAREHKRLSTFHRRRSRERMEELRRFCEVNGIGFDLITRKAETGGRHGHQQRRNF